MEENTVTLAEAKAHLSELTERVAAGEEVVITKHGRPVSRLSRPDLPRQAVDPEPLRRLTERMGLQEEDSGTFTCRLREDSRY